MNNPPLLLASSSPRRRELLSQAGLTFVVVVPAAEELQFEYLTATELCQLNAYRKARAVAKHHPDAIVLGADTLVYLENQRFGKPATRQEAESMLRALQGRTHSVSTGVCLLHLRGHQERVFVDTTDVTFQALDDQRIEGYLAKMNPLDKAGGYAIQEHGEMIVAGLDGSLSNVIGLPMERLAAELKAFGIEVPVLPAVNPPG